MSVSVKGSDPGLSCVQNHGSNLKFRCKRGISKAASSSPRHVGRRRLQLGGGEKAKWIVAVVSQCMVGYGVWRATCPPSYISDIWLANSMVGQAASTVYRSMCLTLYMGTNSRQFVWQDIWLAPPQADVLISSACKIHTSQLSDSAGARQLCQPS